MENGIKDLKTSSQKIRDHLKLAAQEEDLPTEERSPYIEDVYLKTPRKLNIDIVIDDFLSQLTLITYHANITMNSVGKRIIFKLLATQRIFNAQIPALEEE